MTKEIMKPTDKIIKPESEKITRIFVLRHGQTDYDIMRRQDKKIGKSGDIVLNETGKKQAKISGEYLKKFYFNDDSESTAESTADSTIMFVSPDDRAYETAKIIADVNNIDDSNIQNINLLKGCSVNRIENVNIEKEYDYADLVKIHKNTIKSRKDPIEKHKITNFHSFTRKHYDKMESYGIQVEHPESLSKRCDNVVDMITSTPHDNVILVSHSSFLNSFMQNMFGVEWAATGKNKIENSSLSLIECKGNKCTMNTPLNNCHLSFKDKDTN